MVSNDIKRKFERQSSEVHKAFVDVLSNMEKAGNPPMLASIISAATYLISGLIVQELGFNDIDDDTIVVSMDSIKTALDNKVIQMRNDTADLFYSSRYTK